MRNRFSLFLFFFIFWFFPLPSFAAYPGDCTVTVFNNLGENTVQATGYESITIGANGSLVGVGTKTCAPGECEYGNCTHGYNEFNSWYNTGGVGAWMSKGACPAALSGTWSAATAGKTCADLPGPCDEAWNNLATQCGGEDKVASWAQDPTANPPVCVGTCMCPGQDAASLNTECADKGGWFIDWNSYSDATCQPVCGDCRDYNANPVCDNGVWYFDNETCTPICKDCNTAYYDCVDSCTNQGGVKIFDCEGTGPTFSDHCVCKKEPIPPPGPPLPNPDPNPDPNPTPPKPPDPGDDPPPGDTPPGDTPPDGGNDNALLGDIVKNTASTVTNTKRIGDILQNEMNISNANTENIYNRLGDTNGLLAAVGDDIEDLEGELSSIHGEVSESNTHLKGIYGQLGDLNGSVDGVVNGLDTLHGDLDGVEGKLDEISGKLNADYNPAALPATNDYDATISQDQMPVEEDFTQTINDFIDSAPFIGTISSSGIQLADIDPCLELSVFGQDISMCMNDYESQWNAMGFMLVAFASLTSFYIVIGRG